MNKNKLHSVLQKHEKYLYGDTGGARADLRYANLRSADLSGADLRYADLRYADLGSADLRVPVQQTQARHVCRVFSSVNTTSGQ